jgi:hypothetical protein
MWVGIGANGDGGAVSLYILLDHHAGGTFGDGGAGKDADGLTWAHGPVKGMASARLADQGKAVAGGGVAFQGVAIHGRGGKGRLVAAGDGRAGHDAACGLAQRHGFNIQRCNKGEAARKRLIDRDHAPTPDCAAS